MAVKYNPKIESIDQVSIFYRVNEMQASSKIRSFILPNVLNDLIASEKSSLVGSISYVPKPINTSLDGKMQDTEGANPPEINTIIIPKNNKERTMQQRSKAFFKNNDGNSVAMNGVLAIMNLSGSLLEKIGEGHVKGVVNDAETYQAAYASKVVGLLNCAIEDKLIASKYQDDASLSKIANYLLFGDKINKTVLINGEYKVVEDKALTDVARSIWAKEIQRMEKEIMGKNKNEIRRNVGDNTIVNKH